MSDDGPKLPLKDFETVPCTCKIDAFDLLHVQGCKCGALRVAREARDAAQRRADYDAWAEKREMQHFFNGYITPDVTWKRTCSECGHGIHEMQGSGCKDPDCLCGALKP